MKTIIAGSRNIEDEDVVLAAINAAPWDVTELVSGTARGVDRIGENLAMHNGVPIKRFPADWNKHGKAAGYRRNVQMAEYAEALIAVWDGESPGTGHMIDIAKARGLPVYVHKV